MEYYLTLRSVHVACVMIAGGGFLLRGIWMLSRSPLLEHPLTRTLPHVNDSLLLLTAISMAWLARLNPLDHPWLMAKIGGLVIYIVLGSIALRRGRSLWIRSLAFGGALLALGYVVDVALTRNPFLFLP